MMLYTTIVVCLSLFYVLLFSFYSIGWIRIPYFIPSPVKGTTKVSIIISARNEEDYIRNLLGDLLAQSYPSELFTLIVVNDFSEDQTASVVEEFLDNRIRILHLEDYVPDKSIVKSFKKKALEYGIRESLGELIITTDADCRFNSEWLKTIVSFYESKQCHMIVAPVAFLNKNGFLQGFQAIEFIGLIGITGAALWWNTPLICNGANLAFRKESFYKVGGYKGIDQVSSGDDVLLMHKMSKRWSRGVQFLKNTDAICYTEPQSNFISFLHQRIRWASKFKYYANPHIHINILIPFAFYLLIIINVILSFCGREYFLLLAVQLIIKITAEFIFFVGVNRFFKSRKLLSLFLQAQLLHPLYILITGIGGIFYTPKWKGRKIS